MSKVDAVKLQIEKMRAEKIDDGRTLGEVARASVKGMKEDSPAAVIVNTALAINWNWTTHAEPRLEQFKKRYPEAQSFSDLRGLLDSMGERKFCQEVLGIHGKPGNPRYRMLKELVKGFLEYKKRKNITNDWEAIRRWGEEVNIDDLGGDPVVGGVKGIGLATVQNIKLVSGFDTSKPDRRIEEVLGHLRLQNPVHIIELLSELTGYKCIELDQLFWHWDEKQQKKKSKQTS